jgi:hypothetical protein
MVNRFSPMREVLGELLLKADKPAEAQCEFEQSLKAVPNRFRSLAGPGGGLPWGGILTKLACTTVNC